MLTVIHSLKSTEVNLCILHYIQNAHIYPLSGLVYTATSISSMWYYGHTHLDVVTIAVKLVLVLEVSLTSPRNVYTHYNIEYSTLKNSYTLDTVVMCLPCLWINLSCLFCTFGTYHI